MSQQPQGYVRYGAHTERTDTVMVAVPGPDTRDLCTYYETYADSGQRTIRFVRFNEAKRRTGVLQLRTDEILGVWTDEQLSQVQDS